MPRRLPALLLAAGLALAACSNDADDLAATGQGEGTTPTTAAGAASDEPAVRIVSPADGATVSATFELVVEVDGLEVKAAPGHAHDDGDDHGHSHDDGEGHHGAPDVRIAGADHHEGDDVATTSTREGHLHVVVDAPCVEAGGTIPSDETHIHLADGSLVHELTLAPGEHSVCVQFGSFEHVASPHHDQITVTVA